MRTAEIIYLGHDNSIDLLLKNNGAAVNLSTVTAATVTLGGVTISSGNGDTDPVRWAQAGYQTGEIRLYLGHQALTAGASAVRAYVVTYDAANPEGLVWPPISVRIHGDVEV